VPNVQKARKTFSHAACDLAIEPAQSQLSGDAGLQRSGGSGQRVRVLPLTPLRCVRGSERQRGEMASLVPGATQRAFRGFWVNAIS
jgi:hypothetical protein